MNRIYHLQRSLVRLQTSRSYSYLVSISPIANFEILQQLTSSFFRLSADVRISQMYLHIFTSLLTLLPNLSERIQARYRSSQKGYPKPRPFRCCRLQPSKPHWTSRHVSSNPSYSTDLIIATIFMMTLYRGDELKELVGLCRPHTTIVLDEVCSQLGPPSVAIIAE